MWFHACEFAEHCLQLGTRLVFIIPATHDLQVRIGALGRTAEQNRMRRDLAELAVVYDLDYPNDRTRERAEYGGPFHATTRVREIVIRDVWGDPQDRQYARIFDTEHPSSTPRSTLPDRDPRIG